MRPFILAALMLTATAAAPAPARFDAVAFFTGATEGSGRITVLFGPYRAVRVRGQGRVDPDGTLVLNQIVDREGKPQARREWRIQRAAGNRFTGTLSDARGPISGESNGDALHLAYTGKDGVAIEQWLMLAPDGRSATNRLVARKMGMVVARLEETIRKVD